MFVWIVGSVVEAMRAEDVDSGWARWYRPDRLLVESSLLS